MLLMFLAETDTSPVPTDRHESPEAGAVAISKPLLPAELFLGYRNELLGLWY